MLSINQSKAQEAPLGDWLIYVGNKQFNSKWNWEQSIQHRSYDAIADLHQLLIRNGVGFNLSENNNNLSLGYDYILDKQYDDFEIKSIKNVEHRIYQQFITKQRLSRFYWKHRYRFEERFVNGQFKFRFRYALFVNIPINHTDLIDNTFYLSGYNEIFLKNTDNRFDQNWLYAGLGFKINGKVKIDLGYMNQFFIEKNRDQLNIITKLNW